MSTGGICPNCVAGSQGGRAGRPRPSWSEAASPASTASAVGHGVGRAAGGTLVSAVVDGWGSIKQGGASLRVRARLDDLFTTVHGLEPRTAAQRAFVDQAEAHLFTLSGARRGRILQIDEGALPCLMWVAILVASGVTITFCLLCGLENARMHYVMVAGVAAVIGTNLFLVTELNYPFVGDLSVRPTSYVMVVDDLSHGR